MVLLLAPMAHALLQLEISPIKQCASGMQLPASSYRSSTGSLPYGVLHSAQMARTLLPVVSLLPGFGMQLPGNCCSLFLEVQAVLTTSLSVPTVSKWRLLETTRP